MGMKSRRKGCNAERAVAEILRALDFPAARRGRQYSGSPESPDVVGIDGAHLEIKHRQAGNVAKWLDECADDAGPELVPMLVHRSDRTTWKLTLYLGDIWRLYELLHAAQVQRYRDDVAVKTA